MARLVLEGVTRRFAGSGSAALAGLHLDVGDGELLVLVGPSGCGKSTALRLIAGLETPDAGTISLDGRDLARVPPQERDVAMVFQGYALYPHLRVRDNIAFPLKMRRVPAAEQRRRVEEAASTLGIAHLLGRFPSELSGGERQRVAMGRAIVRSPKVFLFDEPLSNLDAKLRAELRVELAALVRRLATTSVYVTHDHVEAMTMADRIAVLEGGVLQQLGTPRAIYEDPANVFVASFLGSPPMNWIDVERDGDRLIGAATSFPAPPGIELPRRSKAGIRPERLHLRDPNAAGQSVTIEGAVVSTEPLGGETHVVVDAAGARLRVKTSGFDAPARGERVRLHVAPKELLWFDASTGARLPHPA